MKKKEGVIVRVLKFFEERGFYIILFLCIAAIGISGYVLFFEDKGDIEDVGLNSQYEEFGSDNYPIEDTPVIADTPVEEPDDKAGAVRIEPVIENSVKANNPVPKPKASFYMRPVPGEILSAYSGDELIKDVTMGDWRVHQGVDFRAKDGERVAAVADGTVKNIFYDGMKGYCILIEHADGIESLYCNLMKNPTARIGDKVKVGDIIGGVGNSMLSESAVEPHLHFEMTKGGQKINPMTLLPKK